MTYSSVPNHSQFYKQELNALVDQSAKHLVEDDNDVALYFEQFRTLADPLLSRCYISEKECNELFYQGFHPDTCRSLRQHLRDMHINRGPGGNFDFWELFDIMHTFFYRIRVAAQAKATRQKSTQEDKGQELKQLISGMWDLSIHDFAYAVLYRQCAYRFLRALQGTQAQTSIGTCTRHTAVEGFSQSSNAASTLVPCSLIHPLIQPCTRLCLHRCYCCLLLQLTEPRCCPFKATRVQFCRLLETI